MSRIRDILLRQPVPAGADPVVVAAGIAAKATDRASLAAIVVPVIAGVSLLGVTAFDAEQADDQQESAQEFQADERRAEESAAQAEEAESVICGEVLERVYRTVVSAPGHSEIMFEIEYADGFLSAEEWEACPMADSYMRELRARYEAGELPDPAPAKPW